MDGSIDVHQMLPQRYFLRRRDRMRVRQRHAEQRVGAEPALVLGAVEVDQALVEPGLVGGILEDRTVSFLVLPGAQQTEVAALGDMVEVAGGAVGGTVRIGDTLLEMSTMLHNGYTNSAYPITER